MAYVVGGLVVMFGLLILVGLRSVEEATRLVFEARLRTAESLALTLERDLAHVTSDIRGFESDLSSTREGPILDGWAADVMGHLARFDSFAFFEADGITVVDGEGRVLSSAGRQLEVEYPSSIGAGDGAEGFQILAAGPGDPGFGAIATGLGGGPESLVAVVHLTGRNSMSEFVPEEYLRPGNSEAASADSNGAGSYHLEVMSQDGVVVLAVGGDEFPGEVSTHYQALLTRGDMADPVILRHVGREAGETDHVMGVVPLGGLGLTLVLEQPVDVALALPIELRRRLIIWSAIGFVAAVAVALVTTRAVVRPARQLTLAVEKMADGDFSSPIEVSAHDEFGVLADRFENMREQIGNAYQAVEAANQELEQRVRDRTETLGVLLSRVISAQEDERQRISRELHDETAQTLGALSIALARACEDLESGSGVAFGQLLKSREMVAMLLEDTRRLIFDLRPTLLDDLGLIPAVRWYADSRLTDAGIEVELEIDAPVERLPAHIETALYRIIQEAMNNVAKHSEADRVRIGLSASNQGVRLTIGDDGRGFDVEGVEGRSTLADHAGLAGMRERVSLLGGQMSVTSRPGSGTTIEIDVPLTEVRT